MVIIILGLILLLAGIFGGKSGGALARFRSLIKVAGTVVILIGILTSSIRQIDAGHIGVQVLFGSVQGGYLREGLTLVNPLVDVKEISVQTQNYTMSGTHDEGTKAGDDAIRCLSKDGLEVTLDLTVLFRIIPSEAPTLYRKIGLDYQDKIIRPISRTGIRECASYFEAIALFSEKREEFEHKIQTKIEEEFKQRGLVLEQLLVRNITLPVSVKESIERKITAIQDAQRMEFVLQKEKQEAERKRVEARGIADGQIILTQGLTDKVLQFEMIKAQKEIATSQNTKIIIMGGKGNVPLFIGDGK